MPLALSPGPEGHSACLYRSGSVWKILYRDANTDWTYTGTTQAECIEKWNKYAEMLNNS